MKLSGRNILITGAAGGIGSAIARRFALEGARLALTDVDAQRLRDLATAIPGAVAISCDLSDRAAVGAVVPDAEAAIGPLSALVHCAAVGQQVNLFDCPLELWQRIQAINLTATFLLCQAAALSMTRRADGVLIALASGAGLRPNAGNVPYGASKAGVMGMMRAFALELATHGVRANVLVPGPTETPLMRQIAGAAVPQLVQRTMLKRLGRPNEIASAAVFLASDDASYVTGTVLLADGGFTSAGTDFRASPSPAP